METRKRRGKKAVEWRKKERACVLCGRGRRRLEAQLYGCSIQGSVGGAFSDFWWGSVGNWHG